MKAPLVCTDGAAQLAGVGFEIREWSHGPNPGPRLHVHHSDDEAWHVFDGALEFRFSDRSVSVGPGATVMAPAGVPHTYRNPGPGDARYLIVTSPRIFAAIDATHRTDVTAEALAEIWRAAESEDLE